jgi:Fic-DOC domain mobile mystery protein B
VAIGASHTPGATPLDPDEIAGLIPRSITTVAALNAYEAENILAAMEWLENARRKDPLSDDFLKELHRRMFGRTWRWAGQYRLTGKNIGVDPANIAVQIRELTRNCRAQIDAGGIPLDHLAARFHHRLVWIHPFANGNGRHARLATDLLLELRGGEPFSWGAANLDNQGPVREAYIEALREADRNNFEPLVAFVRS